MNDDITNQAWIKRYTPAERLKTNSLSRGNTSTWDARRDRFRKKSATGRETAPGAHYQLVLEEVDELVKLIFQIERINPTFFTGSFDEDAKRYLNYQNKSSL